MARCVEAGRGREARRKGPWLGVWELGGAGKPGKRGHGLVCGGWEDSVARGLVAGGRGIVRDIALFQEQ